MKAILVLSILFYVIAWSPIFAELTETDLENIRQIFRAELGKPAIDPINTNFSEIDATFDSIHRHLNRIQII